MDITIKKKWFVKTREEKIDLNYEVDAKKVDISELKFLYRFSAQAHMDQLLRLN